MQESIAVVQTRATELEVKQTRRASPELAPTVAVPANTLVELVNNSR
jgi:hypothetical protein